MTFENDDFGINKKAATTKNKNQMAETQVSQDQVSQSSVAQINGGVKRSRRRSTRRRSTWRTKTRRSARRRSSARRSGSRARKSSTMRIKGGADTYKYDLFGYDAFGRSDSGQLPDDSNFGYSGLNAEDAELVRKHESNKDYAEGYKHYNELVKLHLQMLRAKVNASTAQKLLDGILKYNSRVESNATYPAFLKEFAEGVDAKIEQTKLAIKNGDTSIAQSFEWQSTMEEKKLVYMIMEHLTKVAIGSGQDALEWRTRRARGVKPNPVTYNKLNGGVFGRDADGNLDLGTLPDDSNFGSTGLTAEDKAAVLRQVEKPEYKGAVAEYKKLRALHDTLLFGSKNAPQAQKIISEALTFDEALETNDAIAPWIIKYAKGIDEKLRQLEVMYAASNSKDEKVAYSLEWQVTFEMKKLAYKIMESFSDVAIGSGEKASTWRKARRNGSKDPVWKNENGSEGFVTNDTP